MFSSYFNCAAVEYLIAHRFIWVKKVKHNDTANIDFFFPKSKEEKEMYQKHVPVQIRNCSSLSPLVGLRRVLG